ncbi:MAG: hypothetical protein LC647_15280, partial [Beggiatoa sp.]|nr:hypothetical protein [Beggiatoa sp.]
LEAHEPDWSAIERGVDHLLSTQDSNGEWPAQEGTGVFFRTALLDYTLYRLYFPLWALALYRNRCGQRLHRDLSGVVRYGPDGQGVAAPEAGSR